MNIFLQTFTMIQPCFYFDFIFCVFTGIIPRDKPQEIKTVRIVKRESERRQRDRDRSGNLGIPITNTSSAKRVTVIEEISNENYEVST